MRICAIASLLIAFGTTAALCDTAADRSLDYRHLTLNGHAVRWQPEVKGEIVLKYALADRALEFATAVNCASLRPFDDLQHRVGISRDVVRQELAAAFALWSDVASLRFHEVADPTTANIIIGAQGLPAGRAFAEVFFDSEAKTKVKPISSALVCLNPVAKWKVGFDGNLSVYDLRFSLAHEIGHALGLDHPDQRGQLMWFRYDEQSRDLRKGDVEGIRTLYGPPIVHAEHGKEDAGTE